MEIPAVAYLILQACISPADVFQRKVAHFSCSLVRSKMPLLVWGGQRTRDRTLPKILRPHPQDLLVCSIFDFTSETEQ